MSILYYIVMAHLKYISKPVKVCLLSDEAEKYINEVKPYQPDTIFTIVEVYGDG